MKAFWYRLLLSGGLLSVSSLASAMNASYYYRDVAGRDKVLYDTDGHYWTVLVIATLLKVPEAKVIAYNAEYPDNIINSDGYNVRNRYTFLNPVVQRKIHALTGGTPEKEWAISREMLDLARTAKEKGIAIHRLGDSFSHINDRKGKMFPYLIGHLFQWQGPDDIKNNPDKYLQYVRELITDLGGDCDKLDLTVFNYIAKAGLSGDENSAILKAEYNLINNSIAFNVTSDVLLMVQKYLDARLPRPSAYVVHSNTDDQGKVTHTVVLANKLFSSARISVDLINTTEPSFRPDQKRVNDGLFVAISAGVVTGTISGSDISGDKLKIQRPGFGWDLQVGGALRNNFVLHGILARKTMVSPDNNASGGDCSIDEDVVGIGLTKYLNNSLFFTGNIGVGVFSLTELGTSFLTESGFSYQFKAGKEWRLSKTCSLGVAITYSGTSLTNTWSGGTVEKWNSSIIGFMMNASFSKRP